MTAVMFAMGRAVPRLTPRFGSSRLLTGGLIIAVGIAWLSRLSEGTHYFPGIAIPLALLGIGIGIAFTPLTAAGIAGVAPGDAGAASGLLNVAQQLGGSLGPGHPDHGLRLGQPQRSPAPAGRRLGPRRGEPRAGARRRHLADGLGSPARPGPGEWWSR